MVKIEILVICCVALFFAEARKAVGKFVGKGISYPFSVLNSSGLTTMSGKPISEFLRRYQDDYYYDSYYDDSYYYDSYYDDSYYDSYYYSDEYYYYYSSEEKTGFEDFCEENFYEYYENWQYDEYGNTLGLFPFPGDCVKAIICQGRRATVFSCANAEPNFAFDACDGACVPDAEVRCFEEAIATNCERSGDVDPRCPVGINIQDPVFLPSKSCSSYYECVWGFPELRECDEGQYWHQDLEECNEDVPEGCETGPAPLPDCEVGVREFLPHPNNCNWFIYCPGNGSRSVQQCRHLHHFDVVTGRCVIHTQAVCVKNYSSAKRLN